MNKDNWLLLYVEPWEDGYYLGFETAGGDWWDGDYQNFLIDYDLPEVQEAEKEMLDRAFAKHRYFFVKLYDCAIVSEVGYYLIGLGGVSEAHLEYSSLAIDPMCQSHPEEPASYCEKCYANKICAETEGEAMAAWI